MPNSRQPSVVTSFVVDIQTIAKGLMYRRSVRIVFQGESPGSSAIDTTSISLGNGASWWSWVGKSLVELWVYNLLYVWDSSIDKLQTAGMMWLLDHRKSSNGQDHSWYFNLPMLSIDITALLIDLSDHLQSIEDDVDTLCLTGYFISDHEYSVLHTLVMLVSKCGVYTLV